MRIRGAGGVLVLCWLAVSIAVSARSGLLYLNEEPLSLQQPAVEQDGDLLLPLEELSSRLGIAHASTDDQIVLRGAGFRSAYAFDTFPTIDGIQYVSVEWLLDLVHGELHRVGGDTYLRVDPPEIYDIEVTSQSVTVRLTSFAPHEITRSQTALSEILTIRWQLCELVVPAQIVRVGESDIQDLQLTSSGSAVELVLAIERGVVLHTELLETNESYSITLSISEIASTESIIRLDDGIEVHEWANPTGDATMDYVYVEAWRERFRLAPAVSADGFQASASIADLLGASDASITLTASCPHNNVAPECLIIDDVPFVVSDTPAEVLAIDLFGRWTSFSSLCTVAVKHAGEQMLVDGVNQPLAYGEIRLYSPGYTDTIARGIPGSFLVIKIRDERVVSVYQGPYVPPDATAILLVASGEAMSRLSMIRIGDPVETVCHFVHADDSYRHAMSAGPRLLENGASLFDEYGAASLDDVSGATLIASDWQGGLYMLALGGRSTDSEQAEGGWDLSAVLQALPTAIKDAQLLSLCERNAIAYAIGPNRFQLGMRDPVRLALSLVPLTP